jgi:hypothetical protein
MPGEPIESVARVSAYWLSSERAQVQSELIDL